ncbi:PP2C-domain-containing protein [Rickenella mellea]|uniref:protein-serine/threonine phosphatase n=1 Tax=Rickenella mellea TaxID=50990 RepID=A0A4Y7Q4S3_9AGAM|nr:PP2C-domain-containing protein [Rickenella mellea]
MGQTLSSPATAKSSESAGDARYHYGVSEMQGWRVTMEDAHTTILHLDDQKSLEESNTFFAVYDGHGGGSVAKYAGEHVHKRLVSEEAYQQGDWQTALKKAFLGTDEDIRADPSYFRDPSGCTAVSALITSDKKIFVANAGDSRSVLSVAGEVKPLSYDHKPHNEIETNRIKNAGGYIEYGRVNGNLALSRAIGDFEFKKNFSLGPEQQIITSDPDVIEHQITQDDEFIVLACDGIWDCLSSQQVVDIVRLQVSERKELTEICEFLCDHCLAPDTTSGAGVGCDNMTVLIVAILNGRTKEEWYDWVAERVEKKVGRETPSAVPELYPASRLSAFRVRQKAYEERLAARERYEKAREKQREEEAREREAQEADGTSTWSSANAFGLRSVLGGGGISYTPGGGIVNDSGTSMLFTDDSDDSSDEPDSETPDGKSTTSFLSSIGGPGSSDVTKSLKAQLDELMEDVPKKGVDEDGDADMSEPDDDVKLTDPHPAESPVPPNPQGEAPPHPKPVVNGDTPELEQLKSEPGGDAPSASVKAEGLLDKSEDPVKM